MAWYGQKNYNDRVGNGPYTIAEIGCFVTAFSNLLQKFGETIDPSALNRIFNQRNIYLNIGDGPNVKDGLGWASITAFDGNIQATRINYSAAGSWPTTNNAIVKFAYKSPKTGESTTHFCLVADPKAHTIIDSWDGIIRSPGYYGNPIAWAEYGTVKPQAVTPQPAPSAVVSGDSVYVMQRGDTIWAIAMRYGYTAQELLDYNHIGNPRDLPVGFQVHLPTKVAPAPATTGITYEALNPTKTMHVSKAGGAEKWSLSGIKHWTDFHAIDHTPQNTNLEIAGIAKVLVDGNVAAYYMTKLDFGQCATTGIPTNTIGYNHVDVTEGAYVDPTPAPAPAPVAPAEPAVVQEVIPAPAPTEAPNQFKTTYQAFNAPQVYLAKATINVEELDGRRPDKQLLQNKGVSIAGTFTRNGILYGRPRGAAEAGTWYGVPMAALESEDDVFNQQNPPDAELKQMGLKPLSIGEKAWALVKTFQASLFKAKTIVNKNKK